MAFSLFGKKTAIPAPGTKASLKSGARLDEQPARPTDDALISLDFTHPGDIPPSRREEKIQVQETGEQLPPAIEQAAMLFSSEQAPLACETLEAAIRLEDLGRFVPRAWGMLFDLYQLLGRQQDFETLALEYAAKFESSPPTWTASGADGRESQAASGRSGATLAGSLDLKAQEQLKQLLRFAEKNPCVRLDLTRVTDADEQGCALLLSALRQLKKLHKECVLSGADKLAAILVRKTAPGKREREKSWLLLLELYQQLHEQETFEEAALNYAITFEVSPPSWEPPSVKAEKAAEGPQTVAEAGACVLEGDIVGTDESPFAVIRVQAETKDDVAVDVSRLRRMDFVAAANLMNVVCGLTAARKTVRFLRASHLLAALWEIIGLDRVARIETRKT